VNRLCAIVIFTYAGLAAAQWLAATRWLHAPNDELVCGNVMSDPYMLLVNVVAPLAAVANVAVLCRSVSTRSWPSCTITATVAFVASSGCLAYEGYLLKSAYGLPLSHVWWLPRF
jgi:hypothetical protein